MLIKTLHSMAPNLALLLAILVFIVMIYSTFNPLMPSSVNPRTLL